MNDYELLRRYLIDGSQGDFAQLVGRHVNLVYSAANRLVRDPHLAEDVAQQTFVLLARKGGQLGSDTILSAWLYRAALHLASETLRRDGRRHRREQLAVEAMNLATPEAAWQQIEPMLDEAMADLNATEQDAVMLRYFENKSLKEVGEALGFSEDAAQKRVSRAVERLREFFAKRGVTVGASGLVVGISANAVQAAPVGLAVTISTAVTAAAITTATVATHTTMHWLNIKSISAIVAASIVAGTTTHYAHQRETNRLRSENQDLIAQQDKLAVQRDTALTAANAHDDELQRLRKEKDELLRLRGEVGVLRRQTNELGTLLEQDRRVKKTVANSKPDSKPSFSEPSEAVQQISRPKMYDCRVYLIGLRMFASTNESRLPTNLGEVSSFFESKLGKPLNKPLKSLLTGTNEFEIVFHGRLNQLTDPSSVIIIRERTPWQMPDGRWAKVYGFADGQSLVHYERDGNFEEWEKQRMSSSQSP